MRVLRLSIVWLFWLSSVILFFAPGFEWSLAAFAHGFDVTAFFDGDLKTLRNTEPLLYAILATLFFHFLEEKPHWFEPLRRFDAVLLPLVSLGVIIGVTQFAGTNQDFFYFQF